MSGKDGVLVLESGRVFRGRRFGYQSEGGGEVVFNTALTGYQEILTDPSYCGQVVVMTAPEIGNVGVNSDDAESQRPFCAGLVVRQCSLVASNWRSEEALGEYMERHGIVGLEGVDTRAVTRAIRDGGAQRGLIASADVAAEELLARVRALPEMTGQNLVEEVSCRESYTWEAGPWQAPDLVPPAFTKPVARVVAWDFGIKRGILRDLRGHGCEVTVVPATTSAKMAAELRPDGYFLSNGPGDPAAVGHAIETVKALVDSGKPVFGICLGHQILSLALGAKTFKLPFGHHGGNHPVKDLTTGKVEITSQNHGFAVDPSSLPSGVACTHVNLYDDTVEGIQVTGQPVFGIQYHPEASPGPHDASYLFQRFAGHLSNRR